MSCVIELSPINQIVHPNPESYSRRTRDSIIFSGMTPSTLVEDERRFGKTPCLQPQVQRVRRVLTEQYVLPKRR
jgi:hypothetical protein